MTSPAKLRGKQERFVLEYLKDNNGAAAAVRAGYSSRTARYIACENLTKPNIAARIDQLKEERFNRMVMDIERVLTELTLLADTDIANFFTVGPDGAVQAKDFADMPAGASRCIRKFKARTRKFIDESGRAAVEYLTEIELWSKTEALEMLGRYHKLFSPNESPERFPTKMTINFTDAVPPLTTQQHLTRIADALQERDG